MPPSVSREIAALADAPQPTSETPGHVITTEGHMLLSNVGQASRAIYAFPTSRGGACFVITGLGEGCKEAFPVDQPATIDADTLYLPSQGAPPSEIAGLTEDGVTRVQVVVNGVPNDASFGNNAWYYRFPDGETAPTDASELIVTLADGSTVSVPIDLSPPREIK